MAEKDEPAGFKVDERGRGIDLRSVAGKTLTDDQARTVALVELADSLKELAAGATDLGRSIKKSNL